MQANLSTLEMLQNACGHPEPTSPNSVYNVSDEQYAKAYAKLQEMLNILKQPEMQVERESPMKKGLDDLKLKTDAMLKGIHRWQEDEKANQPVPEKQVQQPPVQQPPQQMQPAVQPVTPAYPN